MCGSEGITVTCPIFLSNYEVLCYKPAMNGLFLDVKMLENCCDTMNMPLADLLLTATKWQKWSKRLGMFQTTF